MVQQALAASAFLLAGAHASSQACGHHLQAPAASHFHSQTLSKKVRELRPVSLEQAYEHVGKSTDPFMLLRPSRTPS